MVNVLVVHPSDELYGADVVLLSLIDALRNDNIKFFVVLPTDMPYEGLLGRELDKRNISFLYYDFSVLRRKYFSFIGILRYSFKFIRSINFFRGLIRKNAIDIVYSNTLAVLPGAFAAHLTGCPHVWHVHEIIERPRFLWRLTSWVSGHMAKKVVGVSGAVAKNLLRGCASLSNNIQVIHNGIDGKKLAEKVCFKQCRFPWNAGGPVAGVIGRISSIKGQEVFLEIAAEVVKGCSDSLFAIVGSPVPGREGVLDNLKEKALDLGLGLGSQVFFEGFRDDVWNVIASLDVVVLPSVQADSFPTIILEAMALSKPVVAYAVGGVPEMIEDGVTGFLVSPGRKDEMAERIEFLFQNEKLRLEMGRAARERVDRLFSLSRFSQEWCEVFKYAFIDE